VHKVILAGLAVAVLACSLLAATPAKSKKKRHSTTTVSAPHARKRSATASKTTAGKTSAASRSKASNVSKATNGSKTTSATAGRKGKKSRTVARSYQQAPSADRYREIQQALASKGYFHGEPNGEWGPESGDALKRFQTDQSLMPDGKINSLSLIALGLGSKRLSAAKSDAPPPAQAAPPATLPATSAPVTPPQ